MRRNGVGHARRSGFRGIGGARSYSPLSESALLAWWDASQLTDGASVSSWVDRSSNALEFTAAGGARPTADADGMTDPTGATWPCVTFDGTTNIMACAGFGAVVDALTAITVFMSLQDAVNGVTAKVLLEHTANVTTNNGGFAWVVNDGASYPDSIEFWTRGAGGNGHRPTPGYLGSLQDPSVYSCCHKFPASGTSIGSTLHRQDNVGLMLGVSTASGVGADTFANSTLYLGARSGPAAAWAGKVRDIVILSGEATETQLRNVFDFMCARVGAWAA